jgi:hypothetical protein
MYEYGIWHTKTIAVGRLSIGVEVYQTFHHLQSS